MSRAWLGRAGHWQSSLCPAQTQGCPHHAPPATTQWSASRAARNCHVPTAGLDSQLPAIAGPCVPVPRGEALRVMGPLGAFGVPAPQEEPHASGRASDSGCEGADRAGLPPPGPCHLREPHADVQFGPKQLPVLLAPPSCGGTGGLCARAAGVQRCRLPASCQGQTPARAPPQALGQRGPRLPPCPLLRPHCSLATEDPGCGRGEGRLGSRRLCLRPCGR